MSHLDQQTRRMKLKDLFLYCVIGTLIAGAAILGGVYNARAGLPHATITKWFGFGIMTAFVFGNGIRFSRQLWDRRMFWVVSGGLAVLHVVVGVLAVSRAEKVGLLSFAVATPVEYFALVNCFEWFFPRKP